MDEWDPELNAYVEDRLDELVEDNDAEPAESTGGVVVGTSCPEGEVSVRRYRTDGFALAGVVTCAGESHTVVLAREAGRLAGDRRHPGRRVFRMRGDG